MRFNDLTGKNNDPKIYVSNFTSTLSWLFVNDYKNTLYIKNQTILYNNSTVHFLTYYR